MAKKSEYWTGARIQTLRYALGENTTAFAGRFGRSRRSVEDWECGRRRPDVLVQRIFAELVKERSLERLLAKVS